MAKTYRLGVLRRAVNVLMTAAIRAGFGPKSSYLLTTTGRRSGEPRTTPVTLVECDGRRWLVAPYGNVGWVHNVRAHAGVVLQRGRSTEVLDAHPADPATAAPVLREYVRAVPITSAFFDARADEPVANFLNEAGRHPVFALSTAAG